jgi:phosphate-selective porin OprO/OprP
VLPDRYFPNGPGAWELTGRYSYLDLDSGGIEGGVLHDWTAGMNWYFGQHARLMFNYVLAHPESFGFEHIFQTRLQLTF